MKTKILISTLSLILISSLCLAKVYQNPQGLFQVDLPSGWGFASSEGTTSFFSGQRGEAFANLMVSTVDLGQEIALSALAADIEQNDLKAQPGYTKLDESKTTFATVQAIQRAYTINNQGVTFAVVDYYFMKDTKAYWVQMATQQNTYNEFERDFQQIYQSFSVGKALPKVSPPPKPSVEKGPKCTPPTGKGAVKFEGLEMAIYTAPDKSFSMYYPKGWTVNLGQLGVTVQQNPQDIMSTTMDVFPLQFGEMSYTSLQIVQNLAGEMKKQYPDFAIVEAQHISNQPDIRGVLFNYTANNIKFGGFGMAISEGNQGMWADIYGKEDSFTTYNPAMVLSYVLQSLNQGEKPNEPKIEIPKEVSNEYHKQKAKDAMMGTHMWNMMPYIAPDAFSTYIPPLF